RRHEDTKKNELSPPGICAHLCSSVDSFARSLRVCGELRPVPSAPADQVEQREEEDPDDIYKVPIEAHDFDGRVMIGSIDSLTCLLYEKQQETGPNHHVQRVQAGHEEVEREEKLNTRGVGGLSGVLGDEIAGN